MLDFTPIGQDGFIIQYEDCISLIGMNALQYMEEQMNHPFTDTDKLRYLNREEYDIERYVMLHKPVPVSITMSDMYKSKIGCRPNLAYAFKMMKAAHDNGIKKFYIYSDEYSPVIHEFVRSLEIKTTYVYGDIIPVLHMLPNCTYTTSNPRNIRKCEKTDVPFALTIVDDFQYVAPIVTDAPLIERLRKKGVYVQFTGVISAGII